MNAFLLQYLPIVIFLGDRGGHRHRLHPRRGCARPKAPTRRSCPPTNAASTPFDDARMKFDVRFYLVSILFIIFDLEVAFLFPWAVVADEAAAGRGRTSPSGR